ncbi:MAG: sugar phosphate isomerase/epimerase [Caldilineaceae bacterium]|nr:sugar phosphate isomerase/epimerase [Caldilineaceae bacterium]
MKVGLDALTLKAVSLDPLELLELTRAHGLEGLHFSARLLEGRDDAYVDRLSEEAEAHGLYLELAGAGVNPGQSGRTVAEMAAEWKPLFTLARRLNAPILNTCFGLLKERTFAAPTLAEQIELTIEVLRELSLMAAEFDTVITMELHVDLTSLELVHIIEAVDSEHVQVNLDTANALGLLEDPVDAARALAPYVHTTHFKDTCIYPTKEGYNWQGGAPLGRGLVDLPAVVEILYQANPNVHLNIEDSGGFIPIPMYDEAFLGSFTDLTPTRMARFVRHLWRGEQQVRAGLHPRPEESKDIDWAAVIPGRLQYNVDYARRLRDETVASAATTANHS